MKLFLLLSILGLAQGEWLRIYSQTGPNEIFKQCELGNCNFGSGDNFINFDDPRMGQLSEYEFKFIWEGSAYDQLIWKQKENPLSATNTNMLPTDVTLSPHGSVLNFAGLSISSGTKTLLDGNIGKNWFYSVGYGVKWEKGNPGVQSDNGNNSAAKTELYVFIPGGDGAEDGGGTCSQSDFLADVSSAAGKLSKMTANYENKRLARRLRKFLKNLAPEKSLKFISKPLRKLNSEMKTRKERREDKCVLSDSTNSPHCAFSAEINDKDISKENVQSSVQLLFAKCIPYLEWGLGECKTRKMKQTLKRFKRKEEVLLTHDKADERYWAPPPVPAE